MAHRFFGRASQSRFTGNRRSRGNSNGNAGGFSSGISGGQSSKNNRSHRPYNPRCLICKEVGHTADRYRNRYVHSETSAHLVEALQSGCSLSDGPSGSDWYLDTGVSAHMTPDSTALDISEQYVGQRISTPAEDHDPLSLAQPHSNAPDPNAHSTAPPSHPMKAANFLSNDDFEPPLIPPKTIPDPDDKKPEDWDERAKIPDPDAKKPDDWDEDAPLDIEDEGAVKPEGWLDDEPEEPKIGMRRRMVNGRLQRLITPNVKRHLDMGSGKGQ
ncbi:unnamed protein product [Fraxinus pennsylvanica]|uniref:Uncharacterized protein n=1 Tax=Fraxinus pennsylvanica TaxID=56036 RepID=A0AAD1YPV0_9LAMI|nr:unnamed protein product [Fraxinus pennsylvanica]